MKPQALHLGDQIGIVAPASPSDSARWKKAVTLLMMLGYQVKIGDSVRAEDGYLAGSDELRAHDLMQMFADTDTQAILCLRGGYGAMRILHLLDYDLIRANPKIFIGYSDITALHTAIYQQTGLHTFHGPMLAELADGLHPATALSLFTLCTMTNAVGTYPTASDAYPITKGIAEGKLVGGNLSLLTATLGTPYAIETTGRILFIEEVDEAPYAIDRMLTQLLLTGKLQQAGGIVFTNFTNCLPSKHKKSQTLREIFHDRVGSLGIPAYYGLDAGHCSPNLTLPIGGKVRMDAGACTLTRFGGGVVSG